ncbi:MAG: TonB-dependent receptor [Desulfobulbaceae bacterium]|nr:TonB-dependent receptor [Desulfobulbaceae bacterium]
MMQKKYGLGALALLAIASGPHDQTLAAEVGMLDEVVVTAGRIEEARKDVTANMTIITREDIEMAAADNLGDLFAELGLSHIQKYPGSLTSIAIRGFRTETHGNDLQGHVLVLLDGRRAGTGNMAKIFTRNVERIEIIRGPGAVQYGSGGVGGVVNIITRRGAGNGIMMEGGAGSYDDYEGTIGATALQKGFDFAGTVTGQTMDDYETGGGEVYKNTGFDSRTGVSLHGGYSFAGGNRLGVIFTGFNADHDGNPGYIAAADADDYTDKYYYSLDMRYDGQDASEKYQWMMRYFLGRDKNEWSYPIASNPDGWDFGTTDINETDQQGAQAQISTDIGFATLVGGFDWVKYKVENTWTPQETEYVNPALFLLGKSAMLDNRLILTAGLRHDWYDVEVVEPVGREEEDSHLTPSIGLAWLAAENLKFRARYAEGFVMPSADQLAADYWNWGIRTVGNPDLEPETSQTIDGGIDYAQGGFNGSITYFTTDFEEKITNFILADGSSSWVNLGSASIDGFELELSYDLGVPMDLAWEVRPYLNMTLLTTHEDEETGEDLLYISDTNYSAGLIISDGRDWFCRLNAAYTGTQDVQDWEALVYPVPVVELDSFVVADLVAGYRFLKTARYGSWTVRGEIRNMFDKDYAYVLGNPMAGRTFFAGLRWEY